MSDDNAGDAGSGCYRHTRPYKFKRKTPPAPGSRFYYVAWQEGEEDPRHNAVRAITMMEANEIFRGQYPERKVLGLSVEYPRR
jgi:hypothetical protein